MANVKLKPEALWVSSMTRRPLFDRFDSDDEARGAEFIEEFSWHTTCNHICVESPLGAYRADPPPIIISVGSPLCGNNIGRLTMRCAFLSCIHPS